MSEIIFPGILVWKNGVIRVGESFSEVLSTTKRAFVLGCFGDAKLIDAHLVVRTIGENSTYRGMGSLGELAFWKKRNIVIVPEWSSETTADLEQVKVILIEALRNPIYRSGGNLSEIRGTIENAENFIELYRLLDAHINSK